MRPNRSAVGRLYPVAPALILGLLLFAPPAQAAHPMDPLTGQELQAAVALLKQHGKVDANTRLPFMNLLEPTKQELAKWERGRAIPRRAFVMLFKGTKTYEARLDLTKGKLESYEHIPGVQPPILAEEYGLAHSIAILDPRFQAALAARNITDYNAVICMPLTAGYDGVPDEKGRRLLRVTCLYAGDTSNGWSRPIENLTAVVDLNARTVLRVVDTGVVTMPTVDAEFPPAQTRAPLRPLTVVQPQGSSARIDGNSITWDKWSFHLRVEQREGLVLSRAIYRDGSEQRPVVHRAAIGEILVPYADVTSNWYFRTYMDAGEYGFGKSVQSLVPNLDCPANAQYIDVVLGDDLGTPYEVKNGICIYERTSHMMVRHFDIFTGSLMTLPGRELVMRAATVVGNYDYYMEWVISQDGSLEFRLGAGGIVAAKAVEARTTKSRTFAKDTLYGPLMDHGLVGTMHQHFFNVRLDMDVDGTKNKVVELRRKLVPANIGQRATGWVLEETVMKREADGQRSDGHHHHTQWLVASSERENKLGYPTGYMVEVHGNEPALLSPEDSAYRRAAFLEHDLWVTPFRADERYSSGDYPNQNPGGDGLPAWTSANRKILDTDVVLWVNVGLGHVPRSEDWPVMPSEWFGSVKLSPFMFFDRNPAIDLPQVP